MIESILSLTGLLSAFWWALSGSILKSSKTKSIILFPLTESAISLLFIIILIITTTKLEIIFGYSTITYSYLFLGSIFSMTGFLFYILALRKIPLGITFTINTSIVMILTVLLDFFINKTPIETTLITGGIVIICGIIIINSITWNLSSIKSSNSNYLIGLIFSIIAGIFWASGIFVNDRGLIEADILSATTIRCIVPLVIYGIIVLIKNPFIYSTTNSKDKVFIFSSSICITIAMLFWYLSLKTNTASLTAILTSTSPVFAILFGILFHKERLKINEILGILFCLIGSMIIILGR